MSKTAIVVQFLVCMTATAQASVLSDMLSSILGGSTDVRSQNAHAWSVVDEMLFDDSFREITSSPWQLSPENVDWLDIGSSTIPRLDSFFRSLAKPQPDADFLSLLPLKMFGSTFNLLLSPMSQFNQRSSVETKWTGYVNEHGQEVSCCEITFTPHAKHPAGGVLSGWIQISSTADKSKVQRIDIQSVDSKPVVVKVPVQDSSKKASHLYDQKELKHILLTKNVPTQQDTIYADHVVGDGAHGIADDVEQDMASQVK